MDYVLQTTSLTKIYGNSRVVNDVSMHVEKGSIYGFIGRNGAGKTTFMRMAAGLAAPSAGSMALFGSGDLEKQRIRIGTLIENPGIYPGMTAHENMETVRRSLGIVDRRRCDELLALAGLSDTGKKKAKHFSLGMRQRLGIAIALCGNPDFLILDEPANGLDPQGIVEIRELILKLNKERQITFLISSHILDELSRLATHYGFIDNGHIVKEISAADLDRTCRKCLCLEVSDIRAFALAADQMGLEYHILSDTQAEIFSKITITKLILPLSEKGCEVLSIHEREESLESYYMSLIGGKTHE